MQHKIIKVDTVNKNLKCISLKVNAKPQVKEKTKDRTITVTGKTKILHRDKTPETKNETKPSRSYPLQHSNSPINRKDNASKFKSEINLFRTGTTGKNKPKENNSSFIKKEDTSVKLRRVNTTMSQSRPCPNKSAVLTRVQSTTTETKQMALGNNGRIIPDNKIASIRKKLEIRPTSAMSINKSFTVGNSNSTPTKERLIFGHKTNSQPKFNRNSNKTFLYFNSNDSNNSDIFDKTADFSSFKENSHLTDIVLETSNKSEMNIFLTLQNENKSDTNVEYEKLQKEISNIIRGQESSFNVEANASNSLITFRKEIQVKREEKRLEGNKPNNKTKKEHKTPISLNFFKQNSSEALTTVSDSNRTKVDQEYKGSKIGVKVTNIKKVQSQHSRLMRSIKI